MIRNFKILLLGSATDTNGADDLAVYKKRETARNEGDTEHWIGIPVENGECTLSYIPGFGMKVIWSGAGGNDDNENDAYFADAGRLIIEKEKASIGMLQRAFKIGFNRAARIMDQLCEAGAVGPEEGTKPRKVLMSSEEFEQYLNEKNG